MIPLHKLLSDSRNLRQALIGFKCSLSGPSPGIRLPLEAKVAPGHEVAGYRGGKQL